MSQRPPIRAVSFDAGRTLMHWWTYTPRQLPALCRLAGIEVAADRERAMSVAAEQVFQATGGSPDDPAGRRAWWRRQYAAGLRAAGIPGALDDLADRVAAAAATLAGARWVLDPDVPAVLDVLRSRGVALAVVSNADGHVSEHLAALGVAHHFAFIADSAILGVRKPDPEILRIACRHLGVTPQECLHVGDRVIADVGVAQAAGARAVLYDPLRALEVACPRVTRLMQVVELVAAGA